MRTRSGSICVYCNSSMGASRVMRMPQGPCKALAEHGTSLVYGGRQRRVDVALSGWGYCKDAAGCVEAQHHEASLNNAI